MFGAPSVERRGRSSANPSREEDLIVSEVFNSKVREMMTGTQSTTPEVSLREQLGGARLFSRTTWSIGAAMAFLVTVAEALELRTFKALYLCGVALVSLVLTRVFQLVLKKYATKQRETAPYQWSIVYLAACGTSLIFFLPVFVLVDIANLSSNSFTYAQLPLALSAGTAWMFMVVVILDIRDREAEQISEQVRQQARRDLIGIQQSKIADEVNRQVHEEITEGLSEGRDRLELLTTQLDTIAHSDDSLSSTIRSISNETVRSLSHRLVDKKNEDVLTPGLINLVRTTIKTQPFRTVDLTLILLFTFTMSEIQMFGFVDGTALLLLGITIFSSICSIANKLMIKFPTAHQRIYLAAFVLLQVNTFATDAVRIRWGAEHITAAYRVAEVGFSAFLVLTTSAFPVWRRQHLKIISLLQNSIDADSRQVFTRNAYLANVTREAALVLHGSVQSRLQACAMSIDNAMEKNDLGEVARALDNARLALSQPVDVGSSQLLAGSEVNLATEVGRKIGLWKDLVAIKWSVVPESVTMAGHLASSTAGVVEEALSNAIRHGRATSIEIEIEVTDDEVILTVHDNGQEFLHDADHPVKRGVGLSLIDAQSSGNWNIKRLGDKTVLVVVLSVSVSDAAAT